MHKKLLADLDNDNWTFKTDVIEVSNVLCVDYRSRDWCKLEYPGHKNGCPNFGLKTHLHCPPHCPKIEEYINLKKPIWMFICTFNLNKHVEQLRAKHPEWTDKQLYCCLYWQGTARKHLKNELEIFMKSRLDYPELTFTNLPEAMGINVFKTLKRLGIKIEKNPKSFVHKIALIGYKL